MRLTACTRIPLAISCALIIGLLGISSSLAASPQKNTSAVSLSKYNKITPAQHKVLVKDFTSDEIAAINEISSRSEIDELVMICKTRPAWRHP